MRNVLYLLNHAGKAGTERYVQALMAGCRAHGLTPFLAYNEGGLLAERAQAMGVPCRQVAMRRPFDMNAARALAAVCRELEIDLVHTNYLRENYVALLMRRFFYPHAKVVYTNHFVQRNGFWVRLANRLMTPGDHAIIAVCEAGARLLAENGNAKGKVLVIHNGVDPAAWAPAEDYGKLRTRERALLGVEEGECAFLCASRFAHDKGHRFLIDSFALLAREYGADGVKLLLAGDGPLLGDVKAQVQAKGLGASVRFVGFVNDMRPLFSAADAYVNPSQHEASSFLILEALASALPVVATDMGGNREIVNDENGCGILLPYGDERRLAGALARLRAEPGLRAAMSKKALATVAGKFSLDRMVQATVQVYREP
jgi:glycosyltransferase involved in cell wall biosynthesis